ncbi:GldG family protein [Maricurvus nonylphenolicus]|uniref:GldG family protein n=1 Tax=Maricurvus nonylphenolicus TaxID=1008307 RepID=UPI0036F25845
MSNSVSVRSLWGKSLATLLVLAAVLLVGVQLLQQLPAWRMDLTEEGIYTLSEGTEDIVSQVEEPIELSFYFSASLAAEVPQFRDYARRIEDLLREYEALNPTKVSVTVVDPEPFSEAEDQAVELGLQGAPLSLGGDSLYMGLAGRSGKDSEAREEVIAFFSPDREQFLEYDISQLIYRLKQTQSPVLGLLSSQSMLGGFDFATRQPSGPWAVVEQLQQIVDVRNLPGTLTAVDKDVDVLMVVHPQALPDSALYAIDQYVLAGGKTLVFVDPHFEGMGQGGLNGSNLQRLFDSWGVSFSAEEVVGDSQWGLRLAASEGAPALPHVGIFGLREEAFNRDSVITGELETVNLASAGYFTQAEAATTNLEPLLQSSDQSMPLAVDDIVGITNHGDLLLDFAATGERYILAANITGAAESAFEARPEMEEGTEEAEQEVEQETEETVLEPHRSESVDAGIQVMLVGDVDMLTDRLWVQVSNFFGQRVAMPWANNGDLVLNAVEVLSGSNSLIAIRSRGQYTRPFTLVNELRNEAAGAFKAQEQRLLEQLENLEASIQAFNSPENGGQLLELNESQQAEVKRFEEERLKVRKELRQVQHQLNQSIESLELRLKLINMLLIPTLLLVAMIGLFVYRRRYH